jgi:hypothetical protein
MFLNHELSFKSVNFNSKTMDFNSKTIDFNSNFDILFLGFNIVNLYYDCLEDEGCVEPNLVGVVIIILLYTNDIVLIVRSPYDLSKQLRILKGFCSSMDMTMNTDKMKVMITKSKSLTYNTFTYDNNNLEEVPSYKYLGIDIHHKFNWNYINEKRITGGWEILLWA